jgi:hypothetical protein
MILLLLEANIGTTYKATSTTKNNAPIKRKALKERTKG